MLGYTEFPSDWHRAVFLDAWPVWLLLVRTPAFRHVTPRTADIVVGLTSYNDVLTISGVVHALREGVSRSLSSNSVQFVLADARSTDGTREAAREALGPSEPLESRVRRRDRAERASVPWQRGARDCIAGDFADSAATGRQGMCRLRRTCLQRGAEVDRTARRSGPHRGV